MEVWLFANISSSLLLSPSSLILPCLLFIIRPLLSTVTQGVLALGCGPHYEYAIEEFCLAKFRLDMQELDQRLWCSWEDTVE